MTLKNELNAEEGSFLLGLRINLIWDHTSFINLMNEIHKEFKNTKNNLELNREIANGVWYISHFIKDWSEHENFPKVFPSEYYLKAYTLIDDISYEYFMGQSIYQSEDGVEKKIKELNTLTIQ